MRLALTEYIDGSLAKAIYEKLEDGTYFGKIPPCKGVVAFAKNLKKCEEDLRSVLEDWIILGLKMGHHLPIINGIDLNQRPRSGQMEAV
ncbi:MAG: type II toxin-antitoxin system HicB family antitoxin [Firmicutes bacterium]|jgi:predicted RNase H-like HicB family nuclease|nr:type II toxin-antitoxin system HicB family antitoxin [Bacillota bacterium]